MTNSFTIVLIFFAVHWYLSLFVQSFFHHRYGAHQQFTMNTGWEKFFYLLSFIFQGSSYLSPRAYAIMHRVHHAHTDTEEDPHSPLYSKHLFEMMWKTKKYYTGLYTYSIEAESKYSKNIPNWAVFDAFADSWFARLCWIAFYMAFYVCFATEWWMYLLLPVHVVMGPVQGMVINWYAHKIGYKNFPLDNTSTNLMNWDLIMLGEGLHNNHHKFPASANFAQKWWEFDPLYLVILLFNTLRMIRLPPGASLP